MKVLLKEAVKYPAENNGDIFYPVFGVFSSDFLRRGTLLSGRMPELVMKHISYFLIFTVCSILSMSAVGHAELYRWVDDHGETHYSTSLISIGSAYMIEVKTQAGWQRYREGQPAAPAQAAISGRKAGKGVTKASIPYFKQGNMMLFDVRLNDREDVRLAMDTGASFLVISPALADKLELTLDSQLPPAQLVTANGTISAPFVNIAIVKLGGIEAYNVTAVVHQLEKWEGLLGMSFFKRFEINVDTPKRRLTLESLYPPKHYADTNCVEAMEWNSQGKLAGTNLKKAATCYEKAISLCDDINEAYYDLAEVYYVRKKYSHGVKTFFAAVRQFPHNAHAHYLLAVFYALDDKFSLARQELKRTLQLAPEHEDAQKMLADMTGKAFRRRGK